VASPVLAIVENHWNIWVYANSIKNTSLTHLDLHSNSISDNGATSISNSLIKNTSLTYLDISTNSISDSGALSISKLLITNTSLTHLDLQRNSISDKGATSISNSLIKNTSLIELYLDNSFSKTVLQSIKSELTINKGSSTVKKKKDHLLGWVPMKRLGLPCLGLDQP